MNRCGRPIHLSFVSSMSGRLLQCGLQVVATSSHGLKLSVFDHMFGVVVVLSNWGLRAIAPTFFFKTQLLQAI
jgi:hypothetical protein